MFGHQDDQSPQTTNAPADAAVDAEDKPSGEPAVQISTTTEPVSNTAGTITPVTDTETPEPAPEQTAEPAPDTATPPADDQPWQHPGTPTADESKKSHEDQIRDIISPAGGFPKRPTFQYPTATMPNIPAQIASPTLQDDSADDPADRELIGIKKQALGDLSPIIDQLDLPPEEKFRTIMMVIQASDDQTMVKAAYTAAHSIEDEKSRAQALLDIINEVNYFTQEPEN